MRDVVHYDYFRWLFNKQAAKKKWNWDHGLLRERYMAFNIQWYFVVSKWDHTEIYSNPATTIT